MKKEFLELFNVTIDYFDLTYNICVLRIIPAYRKEASEGKHFNTL